MKSSRLTAVSVALLAGLTSSAVAQTYTYQDVSYPGAIATYLTSINKSGTAVGSVFDANLQTHGLIYQNGTFTLLDLGSPTAGFTELLYINDEGVIVGSYSSDTEGDSDYLIGPNGSPHKLPILGSNSRNLVAINNLGAYLITVPGDGVGNDYFGSTLVVNKVSTQIQVGVSGNVAATALNSRNQVVGSVYGDGCCSASSGFIYLNGTATLVNYPAQTMTYLYGINDSGVTVGVYMPTGQGAQGFVYNSGTFTQVGYPDAIATSPSSISNAGVICGYYADASDADHAFIATPVQ